MKEPIVSVKKLSAHYGNKKVLSQVTFSVYQGEIKVILGGSGCGKTTLLKHIIGILQPTEGFVSILGSRINQLDGMGDSQILKAMGVLFQNSALLGSLTVGDNVALPLVMHTKLPKDVIRKTVQIQLQQVDLPHSMHLYPQQLSGGMRKRVALARALVMDPQILFCDEPSAGLDPVTAAGIDALLLRLRKTRNLTIVIITHELQSIKIIADSILYLHEGMVLFDGPLPQALAISSGPIADFFNRTESRKHQSEEISQELFRMEKAL